MTKQRSPEELEQRLRDLMEKMYDWHKDLEDMAHHEPDCPFAPPDDPTDEIGEAAAELEDFLNPEEDQT